MPHAILLCRHRILQTHGRRFISSESKQVVPFSISGQDARRAFDVYHRSPLTSTPQLESVQQKYAAFYLMRASATARYRASIGRSMNVPYRDPQTGRVMERQRIVWTTLQPQYTPNITTEYRPADPQSQVYAGFEHYDEQISKFMPIDPASLRSYTSSSISEEDFVMTLDFAQVKLRDRVAEHYIQIIKEALHQRHGAMIKVDQIEVDITLLSTTRALYPLWIFNHADTRAKTLVSGISSKVSAIRTYDPTLSGVLGGAAASAVMLLLLHSPVFSLLVFFLFSFIGRSAARYFPVWKTMRMEGRKAADMLANQRLGGQQSQSGSFDPFGGFNPFGGFGGQTQGGNPFNFDPFGSGGSFQGQRRSSDPFYGAGTQSGRTQQQYSGPPPRRATEDLYSILGVKKTASRDEITTAFRKLALTKHPDKVPAEQKAQASKDFSKINEAYRVLRNPGKRDQYDKYGVVG